MRVGLFGAGSIGQRHLATLLQLPDVDVTAFYDPKQPGSTETVEQLWRTKPDVIFVCTPPATHFQLVTNALHNACHVFCEKPLTVEPWQAETLVGLANKTNKLLAVGYNLRWQLDTFRAQAVGTNTRFFYSGDMRTWPSQYKKDALEELSHELDAAVYINGPVEKVLARQIGDTWRINLRHFHACSEVVISTQADISHRYARSENSAEWTFDDEVNTECYRAEVAMFIEACHAGVMLDDRLCSSIEAAHVVHVIEACRKSAREFRIVRL
jgi:predicted dehydrogenase